MAKWYSFLSRKESTYRPDEQAQLIAKNAARSFENAKSNSKRGYSGAMINRLTSDWSASLTSADAEIRGSLKTLRNRARDLARNNDYVKSYLRSLQNNVIGLGIPFQAQIKKLKANELDQPLNEKIEQVWNDWAKKENCHTAGQLCFADIERLLIRSRAESGEVLVRMIKQKFGNSKIPFALEVIEADLLDDDCNGLSIDGRPIRMGVELDKWNRPTHYYFKQSHPGDYGFSQQNIPNSRDNIRVPASEVIHLFKTDRVGQTRGITDLASTIVRLHHVSGYEEATIIQKRADASLMGFIESPDGELRGDSVFDGERVTEFEPGVIKQLAPGEKISVPTMSKSSGEYDPFMRSQLRAMAAGVGASYETISKDYSQSNYSSSRLALIDDRDNWRSEQRWMIENFHQRVFECWLELAVLSGELKLPAFEITPEKYTAVKWMPRGFAWIDPQKEVQASILAIENGLSSRTSVLAQSGEDFAELMDQLKREQELIRTLGLNFNQEQQQANNKVDQSSTQSADPSSDNNSQGNNNE